MSDDRKRSWFIIRVFGLASVLLIVLAVGWRDLVKRSARKDWTQTLSILVVVVERRPAEPEAVALLRERAWAVEQRLKQELQRYRQSDLVPFRFTVAGPVSHPEPPPAPVDDGFVGLTRLAFDLFRFRRAVDERTGMPSGAFDSAIYVVVSPPASDERRIVEGVSQKGGTLGVVEVELATDTADLAWFIVVHELLHTLGADDRYDATGRTRVPEGLADPDAVPRFPQHRADVMARGRVLAEGEETLPDSIEEIGVGPVTAREIGW